MLPGTPRLQGAIPPMSVFSRLVFNIKALFSKQVDKLENPMVTLDYSYEQLRQQQVKFRQALVGVHDRAEVARGDGAEPPGRRRQGGAGREALPREGRRGERAQDARAQGRRSRRTSTRRTPARRAEQARRDHARAVGAARRADPQLRDREGDREGALPGGEGLRPGRRDHHRDRRGRSRGDAGDRARAARSARSSRPAPARSTT